jgi:ribosome-binding protein aMBF1 (putative translation factor)
MSSRVIRKSDAPPGCTKPGGGTSRPPLTSQKEYGMTEKRDEITRRIAHRLKAARCFRGMEPNELATRADISRRKVERYEATGNLTCDDLEKLAAALRLPVAHFLEYCILCDEPR